MAKLYELTQALERFDLVIDEETGEILNYDELDALEVERNEKIENIGLWIKNLESDADAYSKEAEAFQKKKKAAQNKAERLKEYLDINLKGEKFKSDRVDITYRKSEAVEVEDVKELPAEFIKVVTDYKPDKNAIKQAIKDGESIRGAHIVLRNNIQVK